MDRANERPLERRAAVRTAVVWDSVRRLLDGGRDQRVLDIGGGTGGFAVRVAELGHRVTVVDPSPDALAALARRALEHGVADLVTSQQGDLDGLGDLAGLRDGSGSGLSDGVDLVLCHGVLGVVDDPAAALAAITEVLRPGGTLSLLVSQRHAAVLTRAMAGHFQQARALLEETGADRTGRTGGEHRFTADEVTALLTDAGLTPVAVQAVRVFADLVPSSLLDLEPGAVAGLLELERAVADRPEYLTLASQVHTLATR